MKVQIASAVLLACSALSNVAWSQAASDTAAAPSNDPFVQRRDAIAAANDAYKQKVAAARDVYNQKVDAASDVLDQKVAQAEDERKKAIKAARGGGG
ncbi:hypothetical protein [Pararobbsia silviterrae]|uniref:DUF4398 domain-containing protein n=1 Tax=Pararobbsia silviterrae TaxID=1792498 RepID=A0A494XPN5_9BURK|nr:hypothetical protein [Pararobbsia silviterrae]RKP51772.1 hypothetical protein D7S86_17585 [Pararobbsia silviterrae]